MWNKPTIPVSREAERVLDRLARIGYAGGMTLAGMAALPVLSAAALVSEKRRRTVFQRLGLVGLPDHRYGDRRPVWIHALSVGEMAAALPLAEAVHQACPGLPVVMSAATWTGGCFAREHLPESVADLYFFPFDFPPSVWRVFNRVTPKALVLVETDLWPYSIRYLACRQVPVVLVNARVSDRSAAGYRRMGPLSRGMFRALAAVCAQTPKDADRCHRLGARTVTVSGNIKFDQPLAELTDGDQAAWRQTLGISPGTRVIVAGSTHPGEEAILAEAFARAKARFTDCRLIVAPRDPRRAADVAALFSRRGATARTWATAMTGALPADVTVIDQIGLLARAYHLADVAVIGGSMVRQGGHNPLEAAGLGCPVIFGPDMRDFDAIARLLVAAGAAQPVVDAAELGRVLIHFFEDPSVRARSGAAGRQVYLGNQGALARTMAAIAPWLMDNGTEIH